MSDRERPDLEAVEELRRLLQSLGEEMATLRRRAQVAEARLKEVEEGTAQLAFASTPVRVGAGGVSNDRLVRENELLRARLHTASERTRGLLDRVRFLRQQREAGVER